MPGHMPVSHGMLGPVITGEELAAARSRAHLSQKELAQLLRHGERTIQKWEREGVHPSKEALVRSALGNYLKTESGQQPLASYSDWALLMEIGRRLEARAADRSVVGELGEALGVNTEPEPMTRKTGRGARKMGDQ